MYPPFPKAMMKKDRSFLKNLVLISQVGISVLVPIALMLALGLFLKDRFQANWILIVCILLGISGGMSAAWTLLKKFAPKPEDDEKPEEYDLMQNWKGDGEKKQDQKDDDPLL